MVKYVQALSVLIIICCYEATGLVLEKRVPAPFTDFTKNEIFKPAANANSYGTLYARSLQLPDDSLLMTWENYPQEPPLVNFPIFRSIDGGATWSNYSAVYDQKNGWGMRLQPCLFTLPVDFGGYPVGSILAAGVSTPASMKGGVYIELYVSTDQAKTFNFVSHIAYGDGPNTIKDGDKALWEPFLMMDQGSLIVYYSDQRDPAYSQKLVHTTTKDLRNWTPIVNDEAQSTYKARPGMTGVAHIASTDKYIMTFENCVTDHCGIYYKVSSSPLTFQSATAKKLLTRKGETSVSGPYVIWTPNPAKNDGSGIVIVSGTFQEGVFITDDNVPDNEWTLVPTNHSSAYSRSMRIIDIQGQKKLFLANGGNLGPKEQNGIACAVIEIPSLA